MSWLYHRKGRETGNQIVQISASKFMVFYYAKYCLPTCSPDWSLGLLWCPAESGGKLSLPEGQTAPRSPMLFINSIFPFLKCIYSVDCPTAIVTVKDFAVLRRNQNMSLG